MSSLFLYQFDYVFPFQKDPVWSAKVDRWYQLDAAAFGLTELVWNIKDKPDLIFLASQDASAVSDKLFALSDATSAVRFAHTLPNVRCSPFLQAREWSLPVFCTQFGEKTLYNAINQAALIAKKYQKKIWVLNVLPVSKETGKYRASAVVLDNASQQKTDQISIAEVSQSVFNVPDQQLLSNLERVLCKQEAFTSIGNLSV